MSGTSTITLGLNQTLRVEFEGRDFAYHVLCMNDETDGVDVVLSEAFAINAEEAVKGLIGNNPTVAMLDEFAADRMRPHLKPTMKLRWLTSGDGTLHTLQQWWTDDHQATGEWVVVDSVRDWETLPTTS